MSKIDRSNELFILRHAKKIGWGLTAIAIIIIIVGIITTTLGAFGFAGNINYYSTKLDDITQTINNSW